MIWLLAWSDEDVESCLVGWELGLERVDVHVLGFFDDPEVEGFALYDEIVGIAHFLLYLCYLLAWESGDDAVDECGADIVVVGEPVFKGLVVGSEVIFPEFDVLVDALLEVVAIEEDEFAGHDDESLVGSSAEGLEATVEELCELAWIG